MHTHNYLPMNSITYRNSDQRRGADANIRNIKEATLHLGPTVLSITVCSR